MYNICNNLDSEVLEMREVFAKVMSELAKKDEDIIYLDADIINSIKMTNFSKEFKNQTVNCGIQEANMIGVAAGMSAMGLKPVCHTFAPFATRRVMDQVFVSCAYARLNVKIIGSDPGITAGANGGTHIPMEDIGVMRMIPTSTIIEPTDSVVLEFCLRQVIDLYGLFYLRLSRKKAIKIYEDGSTFEIGKANILREGNDITIIACGICVADAIAVSDKLKKEGINVRVIDMFTIKPIDKDVIIKAAKETKAIVTVENHNTMNGLGSAVCEVVSEHCPTKVIRLGSKDRFGEVGDIEYLKSVYGFSQSDIEKAVLSLYR